MNDKEKREKIITRLSDPNYEGGNYALPENASELEKSKYEICQTIARYKRENELSPRELTYELQISQNRLDDILFCRINLFSLDNLVECLEKLCVPFHLGITKQKENTNLKTLRK